MTVQYEYQEIPFGTGIGEDVAEYSKNAPMLETLTNGRITKQGSVTPRDGYTAYGDAMNLPQRIMALRDQLVVVDSDGATSINNAKIRIKQIKGLDTTPTWVTQGGGDSVCGLTEATIIERRPIARDEWEQADPDVAVDTVNEWVLITWQQAKETPGGGTPAQCIFAVILDLNTWAVVAPIRQISTAAGSKPRAMCGLIGGVAAMQVVYHATANNKIRTVAWSGGSWGTDTVVVSDAHNDGLWDAVAISTAGQDVLNGIWYLAYKDTTPRLNIARCSGLATTHTANIAEIPVVVALHASFDDSLLWVGWFLNATGVRVATFGTAALAVGLAATTLHAMATGTLHNLGALRIAANKAIFTYTLGPSGTSGPTAYYKTITSTGTLGTAGKRYFLTYLSRPTLANGTIYAAMLYDNNSAATNSTARGRDSDGFSTAFTVALTDVNDASTATARYSFRSVAVWMVSFAGNRRGSSTLSHMRVTASNKYCFVHKNEIRQVVQGAASTPYSAGVNGLDLCRFDLDASGRWKGVEFGDCLVFTGAQTMIYDGRAVSEYGFFWPPEGAFAKTAGVGTGQLVAGEYSIQAIWEYRLNTGDVMRSAPAIVREDSSGAVTFSATGTDYAEIDSSPLNLTQKFLAVSGASNEQLKLAPLLCIYRSESNGETLYLDVPSYPAAQGTLTNDVFASDDFTTTTCITHLAETASTPAGLTDAQLIAREEIYTTGGILPNYPMPATDDLVVHRNRLWGISSEDKKTLMFTNVKQDGEMPGWHPYLILRLEDGGDCVALASLDEKLIVFKSDSIWVVYGNGPDRKGVNSDFQIQQIPIDHGCTERRSIARIPSGLMFLSRRGICLLDRKLQVSFVGGPVMDETTADWDIVAAVTLNQDLRVYFVQRGYGEASQGQILVYHWDSNQWAIDLVRFTESQNGLAGGVNIGGTFYLLQGSSSGKVWKHTGGVDPSGDIPYLLVYTSWIPVGTAKQGYGRCRWVQVLGRKTSDYTLAAALYQDRNSASATQTVVFGITDINALYAEQPKLHVAQQKCQEIRVGLLIVGDTDSRCVELSGLGLDIGTKRGLGRLPDANMRG